MQKKKNALFKYELDRKLFFLNVKEFSVYCFNIKFFKIDLLINFNGTASRLGLFMPRD